MTLIEPISLLIPSKTLLSCPKMSQKCPKIVPNISQKCPDHVLIGRFNKSKCPDLIRFGRILFAHMGPRFCATTTIHHNDRAVMHASFAMLAAVLFAPSFSSSAL